MVVAGMLGFNAAILVGERYATPGFVTAVVGCTPLVLAIAVPLLGKRRPAMAAVLSAKADISVEVATLESFAPAANQFGLATAAQSWHWTDPATRHEKVAALLRREGALALFWNRDWLADPDLIEAHLAVHREIAPEMDPSLGPVAEREYPELPDLAVHPAFTDVEQRIYCWTRQLTRDDTLTLLSTHSEYRMLADATRNRLFEALGPVLPDTVEFAGGTVLFLARRDGGIRRS